jgi:uncharacterized coiled-coil DUF342 family protein
MADNLKDKEEDRLLAHFESLIKKRQPLRKEIIKIDEEITTIKEKIRGLNKKNEDEH